MNYMIVHLYDPKCLDDLMLALTAHDVRGAVVVDGKAVAPALLQDVPIFAGFRVDLGEPHDAVKIVLALVRGAAHARAIIDELKDAGIDLNTPTIAKIIVLPAEELN
jgi:hypothetical protein